MATKTKKVKRIPDPTMLKPQKSVKIPVKAKVTLRKLRPIPVPSDVLEKQRLDRLAAAVAVKHDLGVTAIADLKLCVTAFKVAYGSEDVSRADITFFLQYLDDGINKVAAIFEP